MSLVAVFLLVFGTFVTLTFVNSRPGFRSIAAACQPSSERSVMFAWPLEIEAGSGISTASVFARNSDGNPCSNKAVAVSATHGSVEPNSRNTDADGEAQFNFSCQSAGTSVLQATMDGSTQVTQTVSIECQ